MQGLPNRGELQVDTIGYIPYTHEEHMLNTFEVILRQPKNPTYLTPVTLNFDLPQPKIVYSHSLFLIYLP